MIAKNKSSPLKIAVVAAHPDDEALGMGGSLLKFIKLGYEVHLLFISDGVTARSCDKSNIDTREYSLHQAMQFLNPKSYHALQYPDNMLDTIPLLEIAKKIEGFLENVKPDMLFTHFINDLNVDHRVVSQACIIASRPGCKTFVKEILSFEVLSSTDWNLGQIRFSPNYYVDISSNMNEKLSYLNFYKDEMRQYPHARSNENIKALSQLRGSEVFTCYAEGFMLLRSLQDVV